MKTFTSALDRADFAVSVELPLTPDDTGDDIVRFATAVSPYADAIHVPDNRFGRVHMSSLAASAILLKSGFDPIMELGCRNRNRVALISELLGARSIGVTSLLLQRGKKAPEEFVPQAKYVIDTRVTELIEIARNVFADEEMHTPVNYLIGASAAVHDPLQDWNPQRLQEKVASGANFIQTQLCLDIEILQRYMKHMVSNQLTRQASIVVATSPLSDGAAAANARDAQGHVLIPDDTLRRLRNATDSIAEGVAICAEFIRSARAIPGLSGVHITGVTDPDIVCSTLKAAAISC